MFGGVGKRDVDRGRAEGFHYFQRLSRYQQIRRAVGAGADFDVVPGDAAAPARAQSFERGFLGGKTRGVMLRRGGSFTVAIGALFFGKDPLDKPRRSFYRFPDAVNLDYVCSDGNYHR